MSLETITTKILGPRARGMIPSNPKQASQSPENVPGTLKFRCYSKKRAVGIT